MRRLGVWGIVVFLLLLPFVGQAPQVVEAQNRALMPTPPMGWNSWYAFGCQISESHMREQAQLMVRYGLRDVGYNYVMLDDCWSGARDANGRLTTDARFASGIPALANYVHRLRMKFGIYSTRGTHTCQNFPGSQDYEQIDALTFAEWGVDLLKYDNCPWQENPSNEEIQYRFTLMSQSLAAAPRPITFLAVTWGFRDWMPSVAHVVRTNYDIFDNWDSVMTNFDVNSNYAHLSGNGYWNDPDMLAMMGGMSITEYRTWFTLWSVSAAPLILSMDLRTISRPLLDIVRQREVIAINQDPAGVQAVRLTQDATYQVWSKRLSTGEYAIALLNRSGAPAVIAFDGTWLGLGNYKVRDVWARQNVGTFAGAYSAAVEPHGVVLLRITPQ
jgi:alpha-galactosidase